MTAGTKDTFTIYHEQFHSGYTETLVQETEIFNAASQNAIRLVTLDKMGDYANETFFTATSSLVSRRDTSSVSSATDLDLANDELASVKLNRKIGPVLKTLDAMKKIGKSQKEMSFALGEQMAKAVMVNMVDSATRALVAALNQTAAVRHPYAGTMTHGVLSDGKGLLGDAMGRIVCWLGHSKVYTDLEGQAISDKITNVADGVINFGRVGALGLPYIMTDSAPLYISGTTANYNTLGLVQDAVVITESEQREIELQLVTGLENLAYRFQGEVAYNVRVKGYTYDKSSGGANPADAAVATSSNWDKVCSDDKDGPGVIIVSQ